MICYLAPIFIIGSPRAAQALWNQENNSRCVPWNLFSPLRWWCKTYCEQPRGLVYNLSRFRSRENLIIIIIELQADHSNSFARCIICRYFREMVERPDEIRQSFITEFSVDVCMCVLFVTVSKRVGPTSAHSSCHATMQSTAAVSTAGGKDKSSEPDLSLWIHLHCVITAQSVLLLQRANPPYLKALRAVAGMGGDWIVSTHSVIKRHPPAVKRNTPSWHSARNNNNWPSFLTLFWYSQSSLSEK